MGKLQTVAALYVQKGGCYFGLEGVDPWDEERDARLYDGPHPVVAHPPCKRWGRFWWADGSEQPGNDEGLFAAAFAALLRWGGVLEHPADTHAWRAFDIPTPGPGGWARSIIHPRLWTCEVAQRNYGHRAIKRTWLAYAGSSPPARMDWSTPAAPAAYLAQPGRCRSDKPRATCACARCERHFGDAWRPTLVEVERMSKHEQAATPPAFRDALLEMARGA